MFKCATCGKETETCWSDAGVMGMIHGMCQCRECYAKDHPECPSCGELTDKAWEHCAHCGAELKK